MSDTFIESCSYENCSNPSMVECICSNPPKSYCRIHIIGHLKTVRNHGTQRVNFYDQKIWREKVECLNKILDDFKTIKESYMLKIESLLKLKTDEFYTKIDKNFDFARQIAEYFTENSYKNRSGITFEAQFGQSYEESLNTLKEEVDKMSKSVDDIKEIFLMTSDDSWKSKICEEIENSDYKTLFSEKTLLNIDYLYSQTILNFFNFLEKFKDSEADLRDNLKDHYFNKTNFCDKEIILSNVANNLSKENQELLYNIVHLSKKHDTMIQSASNAFSILVKSNYSFNFADFSGIKIPCANLSHRAFYRTNFTNADLSHCDVFKSQFIGCLVDDINFDMLNKSIPSELLRINCVSISHNESWIAASQSYKILIYSSNSPKILKELYYSDDSCIARSISWSYDDKYLASGFFEGHMLIWEPFNEENPLFIEKQDYHKGEILAVSWSPNDYKIATGSTYQDFKIWDIETSKKVYKRKFQGGWILDLLWSQSAKYICYLVGNGVIKVIDVEKKEKILEYRGSDIYCIDWISYDQYIAFGAWKSIKIWHLKTNKICKSSEIEFSSKIRCIKWLVHWCLIAAGLENGFIAVLSVIEIIESDAEFEISILFKIPGHEYEVKSLSWSDKGSLLASGSYDGTVKMWKIKRKNSFEEDQDSSIIRELILTTNQETHSDNATMQENDSLATPILYFEEFLWSSEPK